MPSSAEPRLAAVVVETTFAEVQSDWVANGTPIYVIGPNVEGVTQEVLESENYKRRRQEVHDKIPGLKSGSAYSCEIYPTATGATAAITAPAVDTIQAKIIKSAWGGHDLGHADGVSGGVAATPELDANSGPYVAGDWVFAFDTSAATGEFARIESIAAGPPIAATMLWALGFTPAAADTFNAVITLYPNEDALNNHDDADHTTLGWLVHGEDSEDVFELRGCKASTGDIDIVGDAPVKIPLEHKVTTWATAPSKPAFTATPSGRAPLVPGTGIVTTAKLGTFGGALSAIDFYGSIKFKPAIQHEKVPVAANGVEGVAGYYATGLGEAMLTVQVPYDNAYETAFAAGTKYHFMAQVGNTPTTAVGLYCARMEFAARPKRVEAGGIVAHELSFRLKEDTASTSGLTGNDINKRRAPWVLLLAA